MSQKTITITDASTGAKVKTTLGKRYYVVNATVRSFNFKTKQYEPTPYARVNMRTDSIISAERELRKSYFNTIYHIRYDESDKAVAIPLTETQVHNMVLVAKNRAKKAAAR